MEKVRVNASKSYDIFICAGLLEDAGEYIKRAAGGLKAAIITDNIVDGLFAGAVERSLLSAGYKVSKFVFPSGEGSKNAECFLKILDFLAENGLTRRDVVLALGGGVVGDLAGFAAASYMRGTGLVQMPTTLLAAVDSSVGGKTGIDLRAGKNLAGAFYQPDLVLCDYLTLSSLDEEAFRSGCAEIIKYGVISDPALFEKLKEPVKNQIQEIITRCVEIKRDVVTADEREGGLRQILNFGHTFGHAVELLSGYKTPHGYAVAIGMAMMARAGARLGICSPGCAESIVEMIRRYGLPTDTGFSVDEIYKAALSDKKMDSDAITLVVPREIGSCELRKTSLDELREFIALGLKA